MCFIYMFLKDKDYYYSNTGRSPSYVVVMDV